MGDMPGHHVAGAQCVRFAELAGLLIGAGKKGQPASTVLLGADLGSAQEIAFALATATTVLDAVRDRAKREFRERADLRSEAEIRKAVGYGRYMLREMRALIQLKKYRTLKARGYGAPAQR